MEWKILQNLTFVLLQVRTKHTSVSRRFSVEIWELRIENWLPEFDMYSVLSFKHVTFWWTEKKIFHIYLYKLLIIVEFVQFMRSCSLNWIKGVSHTELTKIHFTDDDLKQMNFCANSAEKIRYDCLGIRKKDYMLRS